MSKLFTTSAIVAACFLSGAANANTVLLDYQGQDVPVENSSEGYDFFDLSHFGPRIDLVQQVQLVDRDVEVKPVPVRVGPFRPDGRVDLTITSFENNIRDARVGEGDGGFGSISLQTHSFSPFIQVLALDADPMQQMMEEIYNPFGQIITQRGAFAFDDGAIATFGAGGESGNLVDDRFDFDSNSINLFGTDSREALLEEEGDSAILGFKIEVVMESFYPEVVYVDDVYEGEGMMYCDIPLRDDVDFIYDDCGPSEEVLATYFGFVEVTRGSVTPGILGVNLVQGAGALVPVSTVPLPAPALLLGAGLAGLAGMRRRRKT